MSMMTAEQHIKGLSKNELFHPHTTSSQMLAANEGSKPNRWEPLAQAVKLNY